MNHILLDYRSELDEIYIDNPDLELNEIDFEIFQMELRYLKQKKVKIINTDDRGYCIVEAFSGKLPFIIIEPNIEERNDK